MTLNNTRAIFSKDGTVKFPSPLETLKSHFSAPGDSRHSAASNAFSSASETSHLTPRFQLERTKLSSEGTSAWRRQVRNTLLVEMTPPPPLSVPHDPYVRFVFRAHLANKVKHSLLFPDFIEFLPTSDEFLALRNK
ncbi:hypothetical protein CEXT_315841 [Caerostris extrusa]|uniref:Uncharacterized protein n=1 Tax=Caerostris extrusa TaxID=172846 RepID=A0AAV4NMV6_CAEEX|nr:hypothetical protein CEXT_315841 [Caerostris extrusa]